MSNAETTKQLNPYYQKQNNIIEQDMSSTYSKTKFTIAEFDLEKFLLIFPEFNQVFEKAQNKFIFMFEMYKNIGLQLFGKEEYGDMQVFCIACFIAHYLELSLSRNKNINNSVTLNSEKPSSTVSKDIGAKERKVYYNDFSNMYRLTTYGQMLYPMMRMIGSMRIRGVY